MSPFRAEGGDAGRGDLAHRDIDREDLDREDGVITGGFTDWHVHLHLIDPALLAASPLSRVHDLGGAPSELARVAAGGITPAASASASGEDPPSPIELLHAGAFLTPPGGYPSDRSWAPADPRPANATRVWVPRDEHGKLDIAAAHRLESPGFA